MRTITLYLLLVFLLPIHVFATSTMCESFQDLITQMKNLKGETKRFNAYNGFKRRKNFDKAVKSANLDETIDSIFKSKSFSSKIHVSKDATGNVTSAKIILEPDIIKVNEVSHRVVVDVNGNYFRIEKIIHDPDQGIIPLYDEYEKIITDSNGLQRKVKVKGTQYVTLDLNYPRSFKPDLLKADNEINVKTHFIFNETF